MNKPLICSTCDLLYLLLELQNARDRVLTHNKNVSTMLIWRNHHVVYLLKSQSLQNWGKPCKNCTRLFKEMPLKTMECLDLKNLVPFLCSTLICLSSFLHLSIVLLIKV
ncbi:hypothetical protein FKM82_015563 [Ascaphus truei]